MGRGQDCGRAQSHINLLSLQAARRRGRRGGRRVAKPTLLGFSHDVWAFPQTRWMRWHPHVSRRRARLGFLAEAGHAAPGAPLVTVNAGEDRRRLELAGVELHLPYPLMSPSHPGVQSQMGSSGVAGEDDRLSRSRSAGWSRRAAYTSTGKPPFPRSVLSRRRRPWRAGGVRIRRIGPVAGMGATDCTLSAGMEAGRRRRRPT